jgi:lipopolysaccharide heptosyltransferase II
MLFGRGMLKKYRGRRPGANALAGPGVGSYIPAVIPPVGPPRILAVRFSSIGDIVLTSPLIRALRARHPEAEITFLTKASFADLVRDSPRLTRVIALASERPLRELAQELRAHRFSHCLDLHGSLRSRALRVLVPGRWRGYRKRRLAREVLIRTKRNVYRDQVPVAERYFEAAEGLDASPDGGPPELFLGDAADRAADDWLRAHGIQPRGFLALAPGVAHATKQWPSDSWARLTESLTGAGHRVVLLGGPADVTLCRSILESSGGQAANAAGQFDLQGSGALIRRARGLVSGDTGLMHMATALATPVVALFGPTVRAFGFFPYAVRATVIERHLPCRPCSAMGGARCPLGHHACLRDIRPEEVTSTLEALVR